MKNEGWVKIYRKLQEDELWTLDPFSRGQAWVDLILIANHKDGIINIRGNIIEVKRGQVGWSELRLSKRWGWSRGKTHNFLFFLSKSGKTIQQKSHIISLITVLNYDKYQSNDTTDRTTDRTTDATLTRSIKNDKNDKEPPNPQKGERVINNKKNKKPFSPEGDRMTFLEGKGWRVCGAQGWVDSNYSEAEIVWK